MKRLALLFLIFPLLLSSCRKDPYADFLISNTSPDVGEMVHFTNRSHDANSYEWDFGDGNFSTNFNASHVYTYSGVFPVTLTAFGKNDRVDVVTRDIVVYQTLASLEIEVVEYTDEYVIPDASVILYPTVTDWENETNMIVEGFTNANGIVLFTGLEANRRYYVDVWEVDHDNYTLAEEDAGWIETQVLAPGIVNSFVAYVDYYPPAKKSSASRKEMKQIRAKSVDSGKIRIRTENKIETLK